jgi:hypothetical protein
VNVLGRIPGRQATLAATSRDGCHTAIAFDDGTVEVCTISPANLSFTQLQTSAPTIPSVAISTSGTFVFTMQSIPGPTGTYRGHYAGQTWQRFRDQWIAFGPAIGFARLSVAPIVLLSRSDDDVYVVGLWFEQYANGFYPNISLRGADAARDVTRGLNPDARPAAGISENSSLMTASDDSRRLAVATMTSVYVCAVPSLELLVRCELPGWRPMWPMSQPLITFDVYDLRFQSNMYDIHIVAQRSCSFLPVSLRQSSGLMRYQVDGSALETRLMKQQLTRRIAATCAPSGQHFAVETEQGRTIYYTRTRHSTDLIHPASEQLLAAAFLTKGQGGQLIRVTTSEIALWDTASGRSAFKLSTNLGHTVSGTVEKELLDGCFSDRRGLTKGSESHKTAGLAGRALAWAINFALVAITPWNMLLLWPGMYGGVISTANVVWDLLGVFSAIGILSLLSLPFAWFITKWFFRAVNIPPPIRMCTSRIPTV